jgi:hypothetical protein
MVNLVKKEQIDVEITLSKAEAYILLGIFGEMSTHSREELVGRIKEHRGSACDVLYPEFLELNNPPTDEELDVASVKLDGMYFKLQNVLDVKRKSDYEL